MYNVHVFTFSCNQGIAMTGQELREDSGKPLVDPEATHIAKVCQAPSSVVLDGKGRTAVLMNSRGR